MYTAIIIICGIYGSWCIYKGFRYWVVGFGKAQLMRDHLNYGNRGRTMAYWNRR